MARRKWLWTLVILPVIGTAGCGGGDSTAKNDMGEIGLAYLQHFKDQKKGPKEATELAVHVKPAVSRKLGEGKFVIIPQVDLNDYKDKGGDYIIAYGKDVPNQGGYVAMADGTVRKMTADEFGKAKKAVSKP